MSEFFGDLLHDLREKRLAPVAAVLLVALVAIPLVLSKGGGEPAPASTQGAEASTADATPTVIRTVENGPDSGGSDLRVFHKRDPFKSGIKLKTTAAGDGVAQLVTPQASPVGGSTATKSSSGSSSSGGGSSPSSGGSPTSTPAPTSTPSPGPQTVKQKKTSYVYVADVTFTRGPHSRRIKKLHRLDMLPGEESPMLIFLGVTAKGNSAVFLVDSTLKASGEGHCRPSADACATLSIGPGAEHEFVEPDGTTLTLRINEIRKVKLAKASASSHKSAHAHTAVGPTRRFVPPVLADIITVASPSGNSSSAKSRGR
jgi:hypothetical protein